VQVTILPHDPPESRLWVDVFVGHHRHSSRDTQSTTSTTDEASAHEAADEQGETRASLKMGEMLINPGEERSVQVELHAFYGAEIGCVAKVRRSPP
jgi:hypothetical protein